MSGGCHVSGLGANNHYNCFCVRHCLSYKHSLNERVDEAVKRLDSVENYLRVELPKMLTDHQNNIESRLEFNHIRLSSEMREFYRSVGDRSIYNQHQALFQKGKNDYENSHDFNTIRFITNVSQ